jgi:class 3 adenylate cyclase
MAEERVERRLAAIFAGDVAGYSRLMEIDEEGTLAALKRHRRELVDPKIKEHRGRVVKLTGDGILVEFASVVDAVRCAVEWWDLPGWKVGRTWLLTKAAVLRWLEAALFPSLPRAEPAGTWASTASYMAAVLCLVVC